MGEEKLSKWWKPRQANVLKKHPLFYAPDSTITFYIDNMGMYKGYKAKAIASDGAVYIVDTVDSRFSPRNVDEWLAAPYDNFIVKGLTVAQAETIVRFVQGDEDELLGA